VKITRKSPDPVKASRLATGDAHAQSSTPRAAEGSAVQLSPLSKPLATVHAPAGTPPVNTERVERIKQAIRDGQYTVNAEKVADKLLEIERGLAPRK
jgi:negative regulator of flagellin synthesis FlgM